MAFPFTEDVQFPIVSGSNDWRTLCEIRSRHTRFSESDVLTDKNPGISCGRADGNGDSGNPVRKHVLAANICNSQELGALDIMLEYGVNPATAECLFLTVQCHGRGSFFNGTFFPGDGVMGYDELMYTMGAALVHGIRGFNLYGLFCPVRWSGQSNRISFPSRTALLGSKRGRPERCRHGDPSSRSGSDLHLC